MAVKQGASPKPTRLALLIHTLSGGGIEQVFLTLASEFAKRGYQVDLLVCRPEGHMSRKVPESVRLVPLKASSRLAAHAMMVRADLGRFRAMLPILLGVKPPWVIKRLPALVRYLRRERPEVVLSGHTSVNLMAAWAKRLARSDARVYVSEHSNLRAQIQVGKWRYWRAYPELIRHAYTSTQGIISVSDGAAEDFARLTGLAKGNITTIYNPVSGPGIHDLASRPLDHPWFIPGEPPVVLGVGRLTDQHKDFATLLRAFARVRAKRPVRLVILGEGRARANLERLAEDLGISADLALPGWAENPLAFMARAGVFVLSSFFDGLPLVLVEAMACGCPVVSTDSPYGPSEILDLGKYGPLVPVGDDVALAEAIASMLDAPVPREKLIERAAMFSVDRAADRYLETMYGSRSSVRAETQNGCRAVTCRASRG